VDRRALQQMTAGVLLTTTVYVPPTTPTEIALVDIWAAVLKLDPCQIGIHHNFFDLGGHSLLAVQVLSRVRTAFTVELPIRDLMDNPHHCRYCRRVTAHATVGDALPSATHRTGRRTRKH
jgi:acyl carrier protein